MAKAKYAAPTGMFTQDHYKMLIAERRNLNDLLATLEKAGQCGIDCSMYKQMRNDIDSQLEKIHVHFMTPPPS